MAHDKIAGRSTIGRTVTTVYKVNLLTSTPDTSPFSFFFSFPLFQRLQRQRLRFPAHLQAGIGSGDVVSLIFFFFFFFHLFSPPPSSFNPFSIYYYYLSPINSINQKLTILQSQIYYLLSYVSRSSKNFITRNHIIEKSNHCKFPM